ncbi:unnamed protein product [Arctogadus glacialis]
MNYLLCSMINIMIMILIILFLLMLIVCVALVMVVMKKSYVTWSSGRGGVGRWRGGSRVLTCGAFNCQ